MAQPVQTYHVVKGPSREELMLALWDRAMGPREVSVGFVDGGSVEFEVDAATRAESSGTMWHVKGTVRINRDDCRKVFLQDYDVHRRTGFLSFVDGNLTDHAHPSVVVLAVNKAVLRQTIICKLGERYQEQHAGHLDEGIHRLLEDARRLHDAQNLETVQEIAETVNAR